MSTPPSTPGHDLLREVLQDQLESVLEKAERAGHPLAAHVEQTLREAVTCGNPAYGFRRIHCVGCGLDRVVGFSCKRRGVCPSCGGRRMSQRAAWWVDRLFPRVPVRQWVLSMPYPLRLRLGQGRPRMGPRPPQSRPRRCAPGHLRFPVPTGKATRALKSPLWIHHCGPEFWEVLDTVRLLHFYGLLLLGRVLDLPLRGRVRNVVAVSSSI